MKGLFDAVKGGNFGNISQSLNDALGGKLDTVMKNAGKPGQAVSQGSFGNVGSLLGSAAIGGVLGALFSGKKAKKLAKSAVLVGGTAAAGALAWNFYQKWSQSKAAQQAPQQAPQQSYQFGDCAPQPTAPVAVEASPAPASSIEDTTALILLEAMIFAARADGHIDEEEKAYIHNAVESLFPDKEMTATLDDFLQKPLAPLALAAKKNSPGPAQAVYRRAWAALNGESVMERSYLDGLAKALNIEESHKNTLEMEALAVRESMA